MLNNKTTTSSQILLRFFVCVRLAPVRSMSITRHSSTSTRESHRHYARMSIHRRDKASLHFLRFPRLPPWPPMCPQPVELLGR